MFRPAFSGEAAIAVEKPRKATRPLPPPIPARDAWRTAPGSSGTPATPPPHRLLLSPSVRLARRAASGPPGPVNPFASLRAWLPVQAAYAGQSLVTIRRTPCGADDREATPSGPPSPRTDPDVRRQAYRPRLFTHACDVASASPAAIAFRDVGPARSVRPTLSGQSFRRAWFPVLAAYASHPAYC